MNICIFFNGTDSNFVDDVNLADSNNTRFRAGEIVSRFADACCKKDEQRVLQIDGVGGSLTGTALGTGLEANVQKGLAFWRWQKADATRFQNKRRILTICGWSRGGITALCLARAVSEEQQKLSNEEKWDIKVIAFDPVAGKGCNIRGLNRKWYEFMSDVSEYHGFYAHDERTVGFATTVPCVVDGKKSGLVLYNTPGTHSVLVGNVLKSGSSSGNVDRVGVATYRSVQEQAHQIFKGWGVKFEQDKMKSWQVRLAEVQRYTGFGSADGSSTEQLESFKAACQKARIFGASLLDGNGRGVYVGGNTTERSWDPTVSLKDFLEGSNEKNWFDFGGKTESKIDKLTSQRGGCRCVDLGESVVSILDGDEPKDVMLKTQVLKTIIAKQAAQLALEKL
jgi:hypothetical protein